MLFLSLRVEEKLCLWILEDSSIFVLKILSELCSNFFDGFVLGFGDFEPNVADKEDLQNDENNENVGSNRQLKKK